MPTTKQTLNQIVTVADLAEELGVGRTRVWQLIEQHDLTGRRLPGTGYWITTREEAKKIPRKRRAGWKAGKSRK